MQANTCVLKRDVFNAIADPTRRGILLSLSQEPQNVNALAEKFDMTRQAVSLHIKYLKECGVISITKEGRERHCQLKAEKLVEVVDWLAPFRQLWAKKFNQLDQLLTELQSTTENNPDRQTTK
ncbi:MAG: metalloregulator ArsR/SmtB family transcription factor [Bacteroidota bacterium]